MELIIAAAAVFNLAALRSYDSVVSYRWHHKNRGEEFIRESSNWHYTFIYSNSDDPRLIVPNRTRGGYTFNFDKTLPWFLMVSGLVLVAAIILLALNRRIICRSC